MVTDLEPWSRRIQSAFGRLMPIGVAGKALVNNYALEIDYNLHKEVLERYAALNLKPYGGFVNPIIEPVVKNGDVVDYRISYTDDFLGQMLEYGREYRTL